MMPQLYITAGAIRDIGALVLALAGLYFFFRLPFEYRGDLRVLAFSMWSRDNLTPKGVVFRGRIFRLIGYSLVWWLGWSMVLVALFLFFPEVR